MKMSQFGGFHRHRRKFLCRALKASVVFLVVSMIALNSVLVKEHSHILAETKETKGEFCSFVKVHLQLAVGPKKVNNTLPPPPLLQSLVISVNYPPFGGHAGCWPLSR